MRAHQHYVSPQPRPALLSMTWPALILRLPRVPATYAAAMIVCAATLTLQRQSLALTE